MECKAFVIYFVFHFTGIAKVFVLWYKKDVFKQLLQELAGIWPVPPLEEEAQSIKNKSIDALRITHRCKYTIVLKTLNLHIQINSQIITNQNEINYFFAGYFFMNVSGVWFYNLTPIGLYLFGLLMGENAKIGFVWVSWYPFDKHQPIAHVAVYLFEIFAGESRNSF